MTEASASGADLDTLSEELFKQLSSGQTVNLGAMFRPAKQGIGQEESGAEANKPQATAAQHQLHLQLAAQAISAAAAAAAVNQGTTPGVLLGTSDRSSSGQLEGAPAASVSGLIRVASEAPAAPVRCATQHLVLKDMPLNTTQGLMLQNTCCKLYSTSICVLDPGQDLAHHHPE